MPDSDSSLNEGPLLADCHLHLEGSLPREFLERLAGRADHPFRDFEVFEERRRGVRDAAGFLLLFADVCRLFRRAEDYAEAARAIGESLAREGVAYAEIYVSPEIFSRMRLDPRACLAGAHLLRWRAVSIDPQQLEHNGKPFGGGDPCFHQ